MGSQGRKIYKLDRKEMRVRGKIEEIAAAVVRMAGLQIAPRCKPFTVICKYAVGTGVGPHTDSDFNSLVDTIVSMTMNGHASFCIKGPKGWRQMWLGGGDRVVFDRSLLHRVSGAIQERVNTTVRFALEDANGVFIWPKWYTPEDGDSEQGGEV